MNKSNKLIIFVIGISTENQILILKIKQSIHYPLQQYNKNHTFGVSNTIK